MSVVETITQKLAQARCQHCGELAFADTGGQASLLDEVSAEEASRWDLLLEAEQVRRHQPTNPQPALKSAMATEVNRLGALRTAESALEEAQRAVQGLRITSGKERRESTHRALAAAEKQLTKAQSEHEIAQGVLESATAADRERAKHDQEHADLFERASAARVELYRHIDELARRAHQLQPTWLAHMPGRVEDEDIEETIARTRAVLAYRRAWGVVDQVSPLGPALAPSSSTFRPEMREIAGKGARGRERLAYLNFYRPDERTASMRL